MAAIFKPIDGNGGKFDTTFLNGLQTLCGNSKSITFIGAPELAALQRCAARLSLTISNVLNAFLTSKTYRNYTNYI